MENVKIISIKEIEDEEELWKTIHKILTLSEKIIISKMGEFNDINFQTLSEIKQLISIARLKAFDMWENTNYAVKYSETGTIKNQG